MVVLILSREHGISLHVSPPMNVASAHYHSLLGDNNYFQFWFQPFVLVLQVTNGGCEAMGTVRTGSGIYGSCTVRSRWDVQVYRGV